MEMMYPNGRTADNIKIQTWACEIDNRNNMLYVETGTTGYQGRGAEHDSRTYFRIEDKVGTDIRAKAIPEKPEKTDNAENNKGIEIVFSGDTELLTFYEALRFTTNILEAQVQNLNGASIEMFDQIQQKLSGSLPEKEYSVIGSGDDFFNPKVICETGNYDDATLIAEAMVAHSPYYDWIYIIRKNGNVLFRGSSKEYGNDESNHAI